MILDSALGIIKLINNGGVYMNKKSTLVVMAAGMGSRYGGVKQIAPMGPNGEIIIDFSVYDAVKSGFSKAVFIIKKEIEKDFREVCGKRIEKLIDTEYVFQGYDSLPDWFEIPNERVKPYGTVHAVLCAKDAVNTPFVVINADDYYGPNTLGIVNEYLSQNKAMCMAGFKLGNTITENGTVSRGVCKVTDGYLTDIVECKQIDKNSGIPLDSTVSMNMWGFNPDIFETLESSFHNFLKNIKDPLKGEYILTDVIDKMIKENNAKIKVLDTPDKWYGVTYKDDTPMVREALTKLIEQGLYRW